MKSIIPVEVQVDEAIGQEYDVTTPEDLKRVGEMEGFSLRTENQARALYRGEEKVGVYIPCSMGMNSTLWPDSALSLAVELSARTQELYANARDVGVEGLLSDYGIRRGLRNPLIDVLAQTDGGPEAVEFLQRVREILERRN